MIKINFILSIALVVLPYFGKSQFSNDSSQNLIKELINTPFVSDKIKNDTIAIEKLFENLLNSNNNSDSIIGSKYQEIIDLIVRQNLWKLDENTYRLKVLIELNKLLKSNNLDINEIRLKQDDIKNSQILGKYYCLIGDYYNNLQSIYYYKLSLNFSNDSNTKSECLKKIGAFFESSNKYEFNEVALKYYLESYKFNKNNREIENTLLVTLQKLMYRGKYIIPETELNNLYKTELRLFITNDQDKNYIWKMSKASLFFRLANYNLQNETYRKFIRLSEIYYLESMKGAILAKDLSNLRVIFENLLYLSATDSYFKTNRTERDKIEQLYLKIIEKYYNNPISIANSFVNISKNRGLFFYNFLIQEKESEERKEYFNSISYYFNKADSILCEQTSNLYYSYAIQNLNLERAKLLEKNIVNFLNNHESIQLDKNLKQFLCGPLNSLIFSNSLSFPTLEKEYLEALQGINKADKYYIDFKNDQEKTFRYLIYILSLIIICSIILFLIFKFRNRNIKIQNKLRDEINRKNKIAFENIILRNTSAVNILKSHTLKQTIPSSLFSYIVLDDKTKTQRENYFKNLRLFYIKLHDYLNKEKITLKNEIEFIKIFSNLYENKNIKVEIINESEDMENYEIPSLLTLSIVENSITKGFCGGNSDNTIIIEIKRISDGIKINIIDNGIGPEAYKLIKESDINFQNDIGQGGKGHKIVLDRINAHNILHDSPKISFDFSKIEENSYGFLSGTISTFNLKFI